MKHVNWLLALVVGLAVGFFTRGAVDGGGRAPARPQAAAQRPPRPMEDPKAVYRVPVGDSPVKGAPDALVTIVESSDFECPFCKRVVPTLKQVEEAYRGKVRFVFKQNPLPFHPKGLLAALATEEARAQGGDAKFWAMRDALFAAPSLEPDAIAQAAAEAGLDVAKVKEAMDSGRHRDRIERDQALVRGLGAGGTPSFFINGRKLTGAQPFEAFRAVIDEELRKAEALVRAGTPAAQVYEKIMERGAASPVFLAGGAQPQPSSPPSGAPRVQPAQAAAPAPRIQPTQAAAPAPPPALYREVKVRPDDPARGPADAKLTVVLFSDFECPFCARVEPSLAELERSFPGQVRIVWKHQPLPNHRRAVPAALAAEAAREQGKFWPMHAKLFQDQRALDDDTIRRYAKEIGLDLRRFEQAFSERKGEARIGEDQRLAAGVGATGTPTMFFNCRQVVGARPAEQLKAVAEEELRKADALLAGRKPDAGFYARACAANLAAAPAAPVPAGATGALPAAEIEIRPDDPVRGGARAPVTIVLFSDFQCPYCARIGPTLDEAQRAYGDRLRIVWKHQPLSFHPHALPAAEAAEAAREQGKFWQMHDGLFAAQRDLSPATYERLAKEIGLDVRRFAEATRSGKFRARVEEDQRLAARIGAQATPTMFVNGEKIEGAVPFATLKAVVDRKLQGR
jgi:protein-disulfide isomerase